MGRMSLEESLGTNNEYNGLYGEVVTRDCYKVRYVADEVSINDPKFVHEKGHSGIKFTPDVVIDLGANVGIFSRYAIELWPKALIIAVEPNPANIEAFKANTDDERIILIEAAIGKGDVFNSSGSNGSNGVYMSENLGYSKQYLNSAWIKSGIQSVMLTDLKKYITGKVLLKVDIEGSENVLLSDPASVELMKTFNYIALELHYFAQDGSKLDAVRKLTNDIIDSFGPTHEVEINHIYAYLKKR